MKSADLASTFLGDVLPFEDQTVAVCLGDSSVPKGSEVTLPCLCLLLNMPSVERHKEGGVNSGGGLFTLFLTAEGRLGYAVSRL